MGKEILTFGHTGIEKNEFYRLKAAILLGDVDIEKIIG